MALSSRFSKALNVPPSRLTPRPPLDLKDRRLITVAALAALGSAKPQLKFQIAGALNVGGSSTEIIEL